MLRLMDGWCREKVEQNKRKGRKKEACQPMFSDSVYSLNRKPVSKALTCAHYHCAPRMARVCTSLFIFTILKLHNIKSFLSPTFVSGCCHFFIKTVLLVSGIRFH